MEKKAVSLWLAPAPFYRPVHLENWDFHDESACLCVCVCIYLCMYTIQERARRGSLSPPCLNRKIRFTCKVIDFLTGSLLAFWTMRDKKEFIWMDQTMLCVFFYHTWVDFYVYTKTPNTHEPIFFWSCGKKKLGKRDMSTLNRYPLHKQEAHLLKWFCSTHRTGIMFHLKGDLLCFFWFVFSPLSFSVFHSLSMKKVFKVKKSKPTELLFPTGNTSPDPPHRLSRL